jgi:hypothetical protein
MEETEEQGRNEQDSMDYEALASVVDQIVQTATAQKQKPATAEQEEKQPANKEALTDSIDEELLCQEADKIEKAAAQKKREVQTDVHTIERHVKKNKRPPTTKDETFIYETPEQIKKKIKKKDPKQKAKCTESHNLQLNNVRCDKKTWTELDEQTAEKIKEFFDTVETNE